MLSDIIHSYFDWIFNLISRLFRVEHYEIQDNDHGQEQTIIVNRLRYELMYMLAYLVGLLVIIFIAIILFFIYVSLSTTKGEG